MLYTCEHICHTHLGLRCGKGKTLSQPLALQPLHLTSLWSTSALLQAGTEEQEGCSGSLLHLRGLTGLQLMSGDDHRVTGISYVAPTDWVPTPSPLGCCEETDALERALVHKALGGARHFIDMLY